jgi:phage protein D/phage baseplate assembly protein gpV
MSENGDLLSQVFVKIDGADASEEFMRDLIEVTVENSLHLPDVATLALHDARLHWIDEASLAPGKTVQISAKTERQEKILFDGEIVEIEPDFDASSQKLLVRAFDRLHRLARGRHVRSFLNVSDEDLIKKIAEEVGLQTQVGPTSQVYPYVFQNNQTNLEFLQERAAALGYLLYVQGKRLCCEAPRSSEAPVELEWGVTLREFHPRMTTIGQVDSVTVRGWDPQGRQEIVGQASKGQDTPQIGQNGSGGELAHNAFGLDAQILVCDRPVRVAAQADRLAQAVADRKAGNFVEAEGICSGNPALVAGASAKIKAVGDRFGGTYYVTGTLHIHNARDGYSTHFNISGHHPSTLLSLLRQEEQPASTMGLVIGIITDNNDPKKQGRVKVKYPWLSAEHASDWARVVAIGAGNQRGIEYLPEINDEVLVGFEMGDIHYPYVLGGLWNGQDAPPKEVVQGGKVQKRVICSRTGHTITLDDSDGGGGITVEDSKGNKIMLDSSSNKLTIAVKGDASLAMDGGLTIEAKGQVQIKGMGVKIDGGASTVDVKGSMINLN